jgi:cytochrome P450
MASALRPLDAIVGDVVLTRYDEVAEALSSRALGQGTAGVEAFERDNILEGVVMQVDGDRHRARRLEENPLFRHSEIAYYDAEVVPGAIAAELPVGPADVEVRDFAYRVGLPVVAAILGLDMGTTPGLPRLLQLNKIFAEGAVIPDSTRDKAELRAEVSAALEAFEAEYISPSISKLSAGPGPKPTLLSVLHGAWDRLEMDPKLLVREIAFFLESGTATASLTLANTIESILDWVDRDPARRHALVSDIRLVQSCVHETLRLRPVLPVTRRRALETTTIAGTVIEKGAIVLLNGEAANRDPSVFGHDPDAFDPYRRPRGSVPIYGVAFGGGPHSCIGRTLAAGSARPTDKGIAGDEGPRGFVALAAHALLTRNARRSSIAPTADGTTLRRRWAKYHVRIA